MLEMGCLFAFWAANNKKWEDIGRIFHTYVLGLLVHRFFFSRAVAFYLHPHFAWKCFLPRGNNVSLLLSR